MSTHDEAAAALAGLDNKHRWDTMDSPMVAKWVDRELQKRRKEGTIGESACHMPHDYVFRQREPGCCRWACKHACSACVQLGCLLHSLLFVQAMHRSAES